LGGWLFVHFLWCARGRAREQSFGSEAHSQESSAEIETNSVHNRATLLSHRARSRSGSNALNEIYEDDVKIISTPDTDALFKLLESGMRLFVAERAKQRVFVHAGVVAWRDSAIIIPGRSYSGKSSMTAAFVRAGATYYSDEYAVLDARGRVHPYLKPISIRENGNYDQTDYPVEALGGKAGTKPLKVRLILVTKYQAGARWRPEHLSEGKGVLEILDHTVSARYKPEIALTTLRQTVKGATVLKANAERPAKLLRRFLNTSAARKFNF